MTSDVIDILLLLAAANCLLLAVLIVHKYGRLYANRFLAALMALYALILSYLLLQELAVFEAHALAGVVLAGLPLLAGPLHYLYADALIHPDRRGWVKISWHAVPFLAYKIYLLVLYVPTGFLADNLPHTLDVGPVHVRWILLNTILSFQAPVYMIATLLLIRRYAARLAGAFSSTEKIRLDWLRNITFLSLSAWAVFFVENALVSTALTATHYNVSSAIAAVYVYLLGYMGLVRSEVFGQPAVAASIRSLEALAPAGLARKYERSGLSAARAAEVAQRLVRLMETEHPYRDSDLTLGQLAERLGSSPHNLSEAINTQLGQSFFDCVNGYRIEDARRALSDPAKLNLTVLAIALDAGFNSKASFNTLFKKRTGKTPSEFRARAARPQ